MKMPKLVIFDMDGLIFDTERLFMREMNKVMKTYGYSISEEQYVQLLGLCDEVLSDKMADMFGKDYPFKEISDKTRERTGKCAENGELKIKEGIPKLLSFFKNENIPCTVASSTYTKYVKKYLEIAGIDSFFKDITGGDCVKRSKPDPEIFETACKKFGVNPKEALVLEDSENGILAAYRAGIPVVCVPDMKYPSAEYTKKTALCIEKADMLIKNLEN